ncbi:MAG: ribosome maturation factor RimM [Alphaproteobacteria bacterium]
MASGSDTSRICVGAIAGAFGVKGQARLRSFMEDEMDIGAFGPVSTEDGQTTYDLEVERVPKAGFVIAWLADGLSREDVEALKGIRLYLPRTKLPMLADPEEFYHSDLIGLFADLEGGEPFGKVVSVQDFGAGDLLEIRLNGTKKTVFLPFTKEAVPIVDAAGGKVVINPPEGLLDDE